MCRRCALPTLATADDTRPTPSRCVKRIRAALQPPPPPPAPFLRPASLSNGAGCAFHARARPFCARAPPFDACMPPFDAAVLCRPLPRLCHPLPHCTILTSPRIARALPLDACATPFRALAPTACSPVPPPPSHGPAPPRVAVSCPCAPRFTAACPINGASWRSRTPSCRAACSHAPPPAYHRAARALAALHIPETMQQTRLGELHPLWALHGLSPAYPLCHWPTRHLTTHPPWCCLACRVPTRLSNSAGCTISPLPCAPSHRPTCPRTVSRHAHLPDPSTAVLCVAPQSLADVPAPPSHTLRRRHTPLRGRHAPQQHRSEAHGPTVSSAPHRCRCAP
ncbi:hypothetical protein DENSPDRAFT_885445 [Dentipellis sp. KUC8613]|nr:hypothetical protein DENSPDRAFT_885445 [Dentipellis sp. KUC8613]